MIEQDGGSIKLQVPKNETAAVAGRLLADLQIADLTIEESSIESVIEQVFASPDETESAGRAQGATAEELRLFEEPESDLAA